MGADEGFDLVPPVRSDDPGSLALWAAFIAEVKRRWRSDPMFQVTADRLVFKVGEHPTLFVDGTRFRRFSSKVTGRASSEGIDRYLRPVAELARMFFQDRVKWWSELTEAADPVYSWDEVRAAERGEQKAVAPSSSSSAAASSAAMPAASPAASGAGVPPVAPPGGLAVPIAAAKPAPAVPAPAPSSSSSSSSAPAAAPSTGWAAPPTEAQFVCGECRLLLPQGSFSKTQLAKGRQRQCQACIKRKQDARRAPKPKARSHVTVEAKDDDEEGEEKDEEEDEEEDDEVFWFDTEPNAFERKFRISSTAPGLLNSVAFPRWLNLTEENDPSLAYYTDPSVEGMFRPKRHWTLLSQIEDSQLVGMGFGRNTLEVSDRMGERYRVAFYEDQPIDIRPLFQSDGHTIAVRYAEKHWFMDGSVGLRVEDLRYVQVIPCSLEQLYQAYIDMQSVKADECAKCKKPAGAAASGAGASAAAASSSSSAAPVSGSVILSACAACHLTRYCSKACQQSDWTADGHKLRCKLFRHLQDLLSVPVEAPRPLPRRFETVPFKTPNLLKAK